MKTLVIGATPNPDRFAFKAVELLSHYGHEVVPLGIKKGNIGEHEIILGKPKLKDIHTVTLYIGAENQAQFYDYIFNLKPLRIIFNPGTENEEFIISAQKHNIEIVTGCTLVMLNSGIF
jgi:hypothetical protein